jgi:hypothetical protein
LSRPDPRNSAPPASAGLLAVAVVLLLIPIVALMWVASYSHDGPRLGGWPFFFWYQMLWVFIASACTYAAYKLVLRARPHRPMVGADDKEDHR